MSFRLKANFPDTRTSAIYPVELVIDSSVIASLEIVGDKEDPGLPYILPGFVDAHVHIESSMLVPSEFARLAVVHGTIATVSDPHEIANVCGLEGVDFMIANGKTVPFKFFFGAPSCVPATVFETAGASLHVGEVEELLSSDDIFYLSEMMNFPGVIHKDPDVLAKIAAAVKAGKPVDGHAPGLSGEPARVYAAAGITTDHECFTAEEALEKLALGMKILIREGSAAKNFDALIPLLNDYPDQMMFCSDDKHPDSLSAGHINELCKRAVENGTDVFKIIKAACINPVLHYKLPVGLGREGDPADFILVKDLSGFEVIQTYIDGVLVADKGNSFIKPARAVAINNFTCTPKQPNDFKVAAAPGETSRKVAVIGAIDGQLITTKGEAVMQVTNGCFSGDITRDILKIAVINRYHPAPVAVGFIQNFGLRQGSIASSVAHDSHNIVTVGVDDESMARAVNLVIHHSGGISYAGAGNEDVLPLPVAGLMSVDDGYEIAAAYTKIDASVKSKGCTLSAPFMTLSFMALLVIPHLKLSDKGMFDGDAFTLTEGRQTV